MQPVGIENNGISANLCPKIHSFVVSTLFVLTLGILHTKFLLLLVVVVV
jgi:hypothetical protein